MSDDPPDPVPATKPKPRCIKCSKPLACTILATHERASSKITVREFKCINPWCERVAAPYRVNPYGRTNPKSWADLIEGAEQLARNGGK